MLRDWRTHLPTQSYDLTQTLAKEEPLWVEVKRVMGSASPLEYERVINILNSMHPDIQAHMHAERLLNEELALEEHPPTPRTNALKFWAVRKPYFSLSPPV